VPAYAPPRNPAHVRLYAPPPPRPGLRVESELALTSFELQRQGIRVESEVPVVRPQGAILSTNRGEFIQQAVTVVTPTRTYVEEVTLVDVGTSAPQVIVDEAALSAATATAVEDSLIFDEQAAWTEPVTPVEQQTTTPIVTYIKRPAEILFEPQLVAQEQPAPAGDPSFNWTPDPVSQPVPVYDPLSDAAYIASLEAYFGFT